MIGTSEKLVVHKPTSIKAMDGSFQTRRTYLFITVLVGLIAFTGGYVIRGTEKNQPQKAKPKIIGTVAPVPTRRALISPPEMSPISTGPTIYGSSTITSILLSPIPLKIGTTSVDKTRGENTYTSNVNHYSITIPEDWKVEDHPGNSIGSPGEVVFSCPEDNRYFPLKLAITTAANENTRYPYKTSEDFRRWYAESITSGEGMRFYKIRNLKVDGKDAIQFVNRTLPGDQTGSWYSVITWVYRDRLSYYFELMQNEKEVTENMNVYNRVIDTVHFD